MKVLWTVFFIVLAFFVLILIYHLLTRRFVSRYTLVVVFGKKGVGKSCTMQKDLMKHHKHGWKCFADSNTDLPYVTKINAKEIFNYRFPENSLVCIDEVNLLWDNRDFKNFDARVQAWFRQQRKMHVKVIAYSQTFDCDKKLRDLADRLAIQRKFARVLSIRRYYVKTPRVISAEEAHDHSRICDDYVKVPWWLGGIDFTYIPKYIKCYNTDEIKKVSLGSRSGAHAPPADAKAMAAKLAANATKSNSN